MFVDQRSDDEIIFRCSCGSSHFVSFARGYLDEDESWGYIDISSEYRPEQGLFNRVKMAWKILRGGCPWVAVVELTPSDIDAIKDWCQRTQDWANG